MKLLVLSSDIFDANSIKYIVIDGAGHGINHEFASIVNIKICEYLSGKMIFN
ncbi:MAG TPA: hypothetical protein VIK78_22775 [Ruminiclostridium sp.]